MSVPVEDYALIGDTHTAALVSRGGSVDWLPLPRFDSGACFAALLGDASNGRWSIAPVEADVRVRRRYRPDTLVLETQFETAAGVVRLIDCMAIGERRPRVVRLVEGVSGDVEMQMEFAPRFDYGAIDPWLRLRRHSLIAMSGPDAVSLRSDAALERSGSAVVTARFRVGAGHRVASVLTWWPSHEPVPKAIEAGRTVEQTAAWWRDWAACCRYEGEWREAVTRSLITLKALTYAPTGAIVAAPTTSLPEQIGGVRNWDYRYCWLRDATLTLLALINAGYRAEAVAFRDWLLRAVAGAPAKLQIMYGVAGERRLDERELGWLAGYEGSVPVRIGNAAAEQFQLDVYGEVIDAMYQATKAGMTLNREAWKMLSGIVDFAASHWHNPADNGMWEVRGGPRHFTHSKALAWTAVDRAIKMIEAHGHAGRLDAYRSLRDRIHAEICERAYDPQRNTFTQSYGSQQLDASLLLLPAVGFLPADDARIRGTVAAVERELLREGFLLRYSTAPGENVDGLPPGEGAFLACTLWLADAYTLLGRHDEARTVFERVLAVRNDVGLLGEEYDRRLRRQVGNFPQAFSHLAIVNTAYNLARRHGPAKQRSSDTAPRISAGDGAPAR